MYESGTGPVFSGGNRLHPNQHGTLEFLSRRKNPAPVVMVQAGGSFNTVAMLDTSSPDSWIQFPSLADTSFVPLGPPAYKIFPYHVEDPIPGYLGIIPSLKLDLVKVETALVYARASKGSLGPLTRGFTHPQPVMILGCDLFRSFTYVQIDYPGSTLSFSTTGVYLPNDEQLVASLPLTDADGAMATTLMIRNQPTTVLIDSAGNYPFMTASGMQPVNRLDAGGWSLTGVQNTTAELQGLKDMEHPRLGYMILKDYKVTFDYKRKRIFFEQFK